VPKNSPLRRHRAEQPRVPIEGTEFKDMNRDERRHVRTRTGKVINFVDPRSYMRVLPGRF
jgi:hypothetical protein